MGNEYDVYKMFATDEDREKKGAVITLAPGVSITVARSGNDNYLSELERRNAESVDELSALAGDARDARDREILLEVIADTILLDFKGMAYDGKAIKYSKANALKLLKIKDFRRLVMVHSNNIEHFRICKEEADIKK